MRLFRSIESMEGTSQMANSPTCVTAVRAGALTASLVALVLVVPAGAFAQADDCPNAQFRSGASAHLPDCRAYEQVSPVDKNGSDIFYGPGVSFGPLPTYSGGGAVVFRSIGAFAGTPWGGTLSSSPYFARRHDNKWQTQALAGRPQNQAANTITLATISPDFSVAAMIAGDSLLPGDPPPEGGLYGRDTVDGSLSRLAPGNGVGQAPPSENPFMWRGGSVTFVASEVLTSDPGVPPPAVPQPNVSRDGKAYEVVNGQLRLVSFLPGETPAIGMVGSFGTGADLRSLSNAMSADGRHIFFTSGTQPPQGPIIPSSHTIYRRSNGATTVLASPSKRTDCAGDPTCGGDGSPDPAPDPLGPGGKQFLTATPDGDRVFFTSPEELTDDANTGVSHDAARRDLYRYDVSGDELVDISAETNTPEGARVQGVLGASDDGDWVYYVALGEVVAGQGTVGEPNVYLWHDDGSADGETRFIATLAPAVGGSNPGDSHNWDWSDSKTSRVTPDGQHLLLLSTRNLTGDLNAGTAFSKVFLYDAAASGGAGGMTCVSCKPGSRPPDGPSDLGEVNGTGIDDPSLYVRVLTDDGQRVFFNSADALVPQDGLYRPQDGNGRLDPYMWQDGELHLLSTGKSADDSRFYGASADGDEAFFLTREQLVGWDRDTAVDLYVAKVGGGFPEPVPPVFCDVLAEACQGPGAPPPGAVADRTATAPEGGDASPGVRPRLAVGRPGARARRRAARRGVLVLRVRASRSGPVRAVARGRVRGDVRRVGGARKRVGAGRRARLRLKLSKAARRHLRAGRRLRLSVRVTTPGARPRTLNVTLRRAGR